MEVEEGEAEGASYQQLYRKYLERQLKKDRLALQRSSEVIGVTPSVSACFQMLTPQLFLWFAIAALFLNP
jgi:hypothetical protein